MNATSRLKLFVVLILAGCSITSFAQQLKKNQFNNPLALQRADPFVTRPMMGFTISLPPCPNTTE
jgi:hypothetical protein